MDRIGADLPRIVPSGPAPRPPEPLRSAPQGPAFRPAAVAPDPDPIRESASSAGEAVRLDLSPAAASDSPARSASQPPAGASRPPIHGSIDLRA